MKGWDFKRQANLDQWQALQAIVDSFRSLVKAQVLSGKSNVEIFDEMVPYISDGIQRAAKSQGWSLPDVCDVASLWILVVLIEAERDGLLK